MGTGAKIAAAAVLAAFCVIGILLCMGKCSFLLGSVRDMEEGEAKTRATKRFGVILLVFTAVLALLLFR